MFQAGCFGQHNPLTPVYVGGTQGPSLGTPVAVYDSLIEGGKGILGAVVPHGTPGELVAPAAFRESPVSRSKRPEESQILGVEGFKNYESLRVKSSNPLGTFSSSLLLPAHLNSP